MENRVETAANKLHDVNVLLRLCENRQLDAGDWVKISHVVRHALNEVKESLCGECTYGDLVPTDLRVSTLHAAIHRLENKDTAK
jgi:hypothetical protein